MQREIEGHRVECCPHGVPLDPGPCEKCEVDAKDLEALRDMSGYKQRQENFDGLQIIVPSGRKPIEEMCASELIEVCYILLHSAIRA